MGESFVAWFSNLRHGWGMTVSITDLQTDYVEPPVFDRETEAFFAWAARAGDAWAREQLVKAGTRWVGLHARRLGHVGARFDEAVAAGNEGLVRAVDSFDPTRRVRLVTFAWPWIARAMTPHQGPAPVEIREEDAASAPVVSQPETLIAMLPPEEAAVVSMRFGFAADDAKPLSRKLVAQRLGLTQWQVRSIEAKAIAHLKERLDRVSDRAP